MRNVGRGTYWGRGAYYGEYSMWVSPCFHATSTNNNWHLTFERSTTYNVASLLYCVLYMLQHAIVTHVSSLANNVIMINNHDISYMSPAHFCETLIIFEKRKWKHDIQRQRKQMQNGISPITTSNNDVHHISIISLIDMTLHG